MRFVQEYLSEADLRALYVACDCYVLPSRGEGWGRPYMEAMACGLPTVATGWGGNSEFMTPDNSYLIETALVPVPERGWREVATFKGHRWAEPNVEHLSETMRCVREHPEESAVVGAKARAGSVYGYRAGCSGRLCRGRPFSDLRLSGVASLWSIRL